jgi:hypothetical protein
MKTDCYPSKGTIIEKLAWYERQHQAAHLALCAQNVPDDFLAMRIVKLANQRDEARTEADIQSAGYTQCRCDLTRMIEQRDEALAEVEPLKRELAQAISERTPHDYGILREQRDEARTDVMLLKGDVNKLLQENWQLAKERDEVRAEVERLKGDIANQMEINRAVAGMKVPTRLEPSRLEIAAMLVAGRFSNTTYVTKVSGDWIKYALNGADALIAAAKEVAK